MRQLCSSTARRLVVLALAATLGPPTLGGNSKATREGDAGEANPSNVAVVEGDLATMSAPAGIDDQQAAFQIEAPTAHQTARGFGVRVAVLDAGFNLDHPYLAGRLGPVHFDAIDLDDDPNDRGDGLDNDGDGLIDEALGHGTFVAGMVLMAAPEAELMCIRVMDDEGRGSEYEIARGLRFAMDQGVQVINLSLEMDHAYYIVQPLIDECEGLGILVVVSAGNGGGDTGRLADIWTTLAVGSVDGGDTVAPFSNDGRGADRVQVYAPGVDVYGPTGCPDTGSNAVWSGTSFSAPMVSGAAALALELYPGAPPAFVRDHLISSTRAVYGLKGKRIKGGRIDLALVVR